MQSVDHKVPTQGGGAAPPPLPPSLDDVDEGPFRAELRRQIAALERRLATFTVDNDPYDPIKVSPERGPAIPSTADLERIRDELLAAESEMHARAVRRGVRSLHGRPPRPPSPARMLLDRLRALLRRG